MDLPACAVVAGFVPADGSPPRIVVDPSAEETLSADFFLEVAAMTQLGLLNYYNHVGCVAADLLLHATTTAMEACISVSETMRKALVAAERKKMRLFLNAT
jgi:exosome complex RNA-binding protein Rrp42 (RNase PH superfamily)